MFSLCRGTNLRNLAFLGLAAAAWIFFVSTYSDMNDYSHTDRSISETADKGVSMTCQRNESAANITGFGTLSETMKNFFYYRHCRHFPLLLDIPYKCGGTENSRNVFLLLVIKSSPENYERREVLRKTWAKDRQYNGAWVRRIFISGTSGEGFEKQRRNKLLMLEQREHKDILQWDFTDTFYNLTLKQILFLEWKERNCPHHRFLLNGDDDVFANTPNMVEYLQGLPNDGSKHLFTGYLFLNTGPVRWPQSKYFVPYQVQESDTYPPYCGGGGYLMSGATASAIYNMSFVVPIHPIDDAYIGMCLAEAGIMPTSHIGVKTLGLNMLSRTHDVLHPCHMKELLLVHRFFPGEMYLMWKQIQNPNLNCSPVRKL